MKETQIMELCIGSGFSARIYRDLQGEPARKAVIERDIAEGEMVFENIANTHVLATKERRDRCSYCFCRPSTLSVCSKCKFAHYCNQSCQRQDWHTGGHRYECKHATDLIAQGCSPDVLDEILLMCRNLFRDPVFAALKKGGSAAALASEACTMLEDGTVRCGYLHINDLSQSGDAVLCDDTAVATIGEAFRRIKGSLRFSDPAEEANLSKALLARLSRMLVQFRTNNFAIVDHMMRPVGAAVFPHAAILNHSCEPSGLLGYRFVQGKPPSVYCIALKALCEGDELTHCYVDSTVSMKSRAQALSRYGFSCECQRCSATHAGDTKAIELLRTLRSDRIYGERPDRLRDLLAQTNAVTPGVSTCVADMLLSESANTAHLSDLKDALMSNSEVEVVPPEESLVRDIATCIDVAPLFHPRSYELRAAIFTLLLPYAAQCQPEDLAYRVAARLASQLCSYLTLSLSSFTFHPLLALQLATLGGLQQSPELLSWSLVGLKKSFGSDRSGDKGTMISSVEEQIKLLESNGVPWDNAVVDL